MDCLWLRDGGAKTAARVTPVGKEGWLTLELWDKSSEDVRERWRDIARILRNADDAEEVPRALQTAFWFGFQAGSAPHGPKAEGSLLNLLPPDVASEVLKHATKPQPTSSDPTTGGRSRRVRPPGR